MGELEMIKDGVSTRIERDGSITKELVAYCDSCLDWQSVLGGTATRLAGEEILWICASCRTPR